MINKVCEAKHFSSDVSLGTLIYSENCGSITTLGYKNSHGDTIGGDVLKKHVKFYPPDDFVFTTTDACGLRIWDRERQKVLYKYKEEHLYAHAYSENCILASFDDYNIKFYDLKCRYLASSRPSPGNKKIGWIGEYIYCFNGEAIDVFDYRNLEAPACTFQNVFDFAVCDGACYFITRDNEKFYLVHTDPKIGTSTYLKKEVPYSRVFPLKGHDSIVGVTKDGLRIESYGSLENVRMKDYRVEALHFSDSNGYLFANGFLFEIDGSLKDFCTK